MPRGVCSLPQYPSIAQSNLAGFLEHVRVPEDRRKRGIPINTAAVSFKVCLSVELGHLMRQEQATYCIDGHGSEHYAGNHGPILGVLLPTDEFGVVGLEKESQGC